MLLKIYNITVSKTNWYIINYAIERLNVSCIELIAYLNNLDRTPPDSNVNYSHGCDFWMDLINTFYLAYTLKFYDAYITERWYYRCVASMYRDKLFDMCLLFVSYEVKLNIYSSGTFFFHYHNHYVIFPLFQYSLLSSFVF